MGEDEGRDGGIVVKLALRLAAVLLLVAAAGLAAAGWYFSDLIESGTLHVDHSYRLDVRVVSVGDGKVVLEGSSKNLPREGIWGLQWPGGYGRAGSVVSIDGKTVVRELNPDWDRPPPGTLVRLDSLSFPPDPRRALGAVYEDVTIRSPGGEFPAWLFPGSRRTWVIGVHGMGSRREEAFRLFETTVELGFPSLTVTYRNDEGVARSADDRYDYGRSEWQDLEAAVAYALDHGASDVVLAGYSMGAAVVMSFLERSELADATSALVLDAPVLSFEKVIDFQAERRSLPGFLTRIAKKMTGWRFGVDWDAVDYRETAQNLRIPVLLFHGVEDDRAPVSVSDAFARARPDIVTYVRVAGAHHARSWNVDPAGYGAAVREFLARTAGAGP